MEWLISAGTAFVAIAPVELPDKTFIATLVLATRYRPLPVWLGVISAFAVHVTVAVVAGSLIALLPELPVRLAAAALFAAGAVIMWRGARAADASEQTREYEQKVVDTRAGWRAFGASFLLLFTAEWGDLSQLLTAFLVGSGHAPSAVLAGSWIALALVSGAAVLLGTWLLRHVRLSVMRYLAGGVCAVLAAVIAITALA